MHDLDVPRVAAPVDLVVPRRAQEGSGPATGEHDPSLVGLPKRNFRATAKRRVSRPRERLYQTTNPVFGATFRRATSGARTTRRARRAARPRAPWQRVDVQEERVAVVKIRRADARGHRRLATGPARGAAGPWAWSPPNRSANPSRRVLLERQAPDGEHERARPRPPPKLRRAVAGGEAAAPGIGTGCSTGAFSRGQKRHAAARGTPALGASCRPANQSRRHAARLAARPGCGSPRRPRAARWRSAPARSRSPGPRPGPQSPRTALGSMRPRHGVAASGGARASRWRRCRRAEPAHGRPAGPCLPFSNQSLKAKLAKVVEQPPGPGAACGRGGPLAWLASVLLRWLSGLL